VGGASACGDTGNESHEVGPVAKMGAVFTDNNRGGFSRGRCGGCSNRIHNGGGLRETSPEPTKPGSNFTKNYHNWGQSISTPGNGFVGI